MNKLTNAVKKGVVAPIAWLKDTGMNLSEIFPPTTDTTNTRERTETLNMCRLFRICWRGTNPVKRTTMLRIKHESMCSIVRKIGYLKPQRLNKYLFNNNTPILDMYHDAIMQTANVSKFAACISDASLILQVSFEDSGCGKSLEFDFTPQIKFMFVWGCGIFLSLDIKLIYS